MSDRSDLGQKKPYALILKKKMFCFKLLLLIVLIGLDRLMDNPCHIYSVYSIWIFKIIVQIQKCTIIFPRYCSDWGWVGQQQSEHCSDLENGMEKWMLQDWSWLKSPTLSHALSPINSHKKNRCRMTWTVTNKSQWLLMVLFYVLAYFCNISTVKCLSWSLSFP